MLLVSTDSAGYKSENPRTPWDLSVAQSRDLIETTKVRNALEDSFYLIVLYKGVMVMLETGQSLGR